MSESVTSVERLDASIRGASTVRRRWPHVLTVSVVTFGFPYAIHVVLVNVARIPSVLAQAISIACGTPPAFVGNKLWSFTNY